MVEQPKDAPRIALVAVFIAPHATAIGGQAGTTEAYPVNNHGRDSAAVRHSAHGIVVLPVFGKSRNFVPKDFPHMTVVAHDDVFREEAGEVDVTGWAEPLLFGLAKRERGSDFVGDFRAEGATEFANPLFEGLAFQPNQRWAVGKRELREWHVCLLTGDIRISESREDSLLPGWVILPNIMPRCCAQKRIRFDLVFDWRKQNMHYRAQFMCHRRRVNRNALPAVGKDGELFLVRRFDLKPVMRGVLVVSSVARPTRSVVVSACCERQEDGHARHGLDVAHAEPTTFLPTPKPAMIENIARVLRFPDRHRTKLVALVVWEGVWLHVVR